MNSLNKTQRGFSLIELLIVVVIIGIIAAIAIPNLLKARMAANEASAISSLRVLHSAEIIYQATTGRGEFAGRVANLQAANIVDSSFAPSGSAAVKSGYVFNSFGASPNGFLGRPASFGYYAIPVAPSTSGQARATGSRDFAIGTSGVIYVAPAALSASGHIYPGFGDGLFYKDGQVWNGTLNY